MAKTTFEEIQPIMKACVVAEVTSHGAPWVEDRAMVNPDPTKGYYLNNDEYDLGCRRIAAAFNVASGNGQAGIPVSLSDRVWQARYAARSVELFNSAASNRALDAANPGASGES